MFTMPTEDGFVRNEEKEIWQQPMLTLINVRDTKGGAIPTGTEDAFMGNRRTDCSPWIWCHEDLS